MAGRHAPRRVGAGLALLSIVCAPSALAGTLYKCVARGSVAYQTSPCEPGSVTAWTREFQPDPPPPAARARSADPRGKEPRERYVAYRPVRWRVQREPLDPCEAAKAKRERELARVGLKRTFDLLRRLDDEVYDACK